MSIDPTTSRTTPPTPIPDALPVASLGRTRAASGATVLGQVMSLVAVAIGVLALGAYLGRDLSPGAGVAFSFGGLGLLLVQSFGGKRFRVGGFALGWLFAVSLVTGLGLGPVLGYYAKVDPSAITRSVGATTLIVAGMGTTGVLVGRDLSGWLRPLAYAVLGIVITGIASIVLGSGDNPFLSLAIGVVSALLILVDFNLLRRQGTEDDVVVLATGIFVSIVNVFLSLLSILGDD